MSEKTVSIRKCDVVACKSETEKPIGYGATGWITVYQDGRRIDICPHHAPDVIRDLEKAGVPSSITRPEQPSWEKNS